MNLTLPTGWIVGQNKLFVPVEHLKYIVEHKRKKQYPIEELHIPVLALSKMFRALFSNDVLDLAIQLKECEHEADAERLCSDLTFIPHGT